MIFIGEIYDEQTAINALHYAETGHLVISTLRSSGIKQAVSRMIGFFPSSEQSQIRSKLAASLRVVLYQQLIP